MSGGDGAFGCARERARERRRGRVRRSGGPNGSGVSLAASRWLGEGQVGSCVPACAGAVLGLASASRQRLRTGLPLVGWPTMLGLGALPGEHSLSLSF